MSRQMDYKENLAKYEKVALAIDHLVRCMETQTEGAGMPTLEELATEVNLSPHHFQRVFKAGAGISPKRFLQYMAAGRAREALLAGQSILEASFTAGLSGPSRLHDLTLISEAMTPAQVRKKGAGEVIYYDVVASPFGSALMGATVKGICWLSFLDGSSKDHARGLQELTQDWPGAKLHKDSDFIAPLAKGAFVFSHHNKAANTDQTAVENKIGLHIKGSNFQLKVWEALLKIPHGVLITYGDLAKMIGSPKASRAVGSAVGANAISLLIPCHRVILSSGIVHNYRWGTARKKAILALEVPH